MRFSIALLLALPIWAQHDMNNMPDMPGMDHHAAASTDAKPGWRFMLHGTAFITDIQQTGPRGADKFISTSWFMTQADHVFAGGSFTARAMLSLDPLTVTERSYPELFQTGETAFGKTIVDGQHPHDFVMELALRYSHPIGAKASWDIYAAPVGDPALGPVAFPHRESAAELPQAPLAHHLQDSTHVSDEVVTAALTRGMLRLEASGFHGGEPNENRWNIDHGPIDSWSGRVTFTPDAAWSGQVSAGRLTKPEALEPGDQVRTTASVTHTRGHWATSAIWGRVHKTGSGANLNGYSLESVARFAEKNYLTGRIELADKDELLPTGQTFRIGAYTGGYTRDFNLLPGFTTGLGFNFTTYSLPAALAPVYGQHPMAAVVFLRVRVHH